MATRILAALIGLAVVLPAILYGGELAIQIMASIVLLVGLDEYCRMQLPDHYRAAMVLLVPIAGAFFAALVLGSTEQALWVLGLGGLACMLFGLFAVKDTNKGSDAASKLFMGLLWPTLLLAFLPWLRTFDHGVAWLLLPLVIVWGGDSGAFFSGRAFGKHKLFERISPKKTWEGVWGGIVASVVGAGIVKHLGLPDVSWGHIVAIAVIGNAFGVVGDLAESLVKRAAGVKDSGWIMPGHGGILDRIDSVLFAAPVVYVLARVFGLA